MRRGHAQLLASSTAERILLCAKPERCPSSGSAANEAALRGFLQERPACRKDSYLSLFWVCVLNDDKIISMNELEIRKQELLTVCEESLSVIKNGFNNVRFKQEKTKGDFVTNVDIESEKLILEHLGSRFPHDTLITEESDGSIGDSSYTWIIDPLDGTNNFLRGIPLAGLLVALIKDDKPMLGLLANLVDDGIYFTEAGNGGFATNFNLQWKNKLSVSQRTLADSMIVISSNIAQDASHRQSRVIEAVFPRAASCRVFGVAANEFPYVANGSIEAIISNNPKSMDITAGSLLIEEAGGKVTTYDGKPWSPNMETIVASNGLIHDELLELIAKVTAYDQ